LRYEHIRILPDHVVRRIRAGEVVERPASLVKELIENSLDAGADKIIVRCARGGRDISVEDNGRGMGPDDLTLCTTRHATSKLHGDDITAISYYGFRGEALASASVCSTLTVLSRSLDDYHAWILRPGQSTPEPAAGCIGTTVWAKDIFGSHPARASFLKSARTENAAIKTVVEDAALVNPSISFTFYVEDRVALNLLHVSQDVRLQDVLGKDFVESSVAFTSSISGMTIDGRIGLPTWDGHQRIGQKFFVNGRPIRDRVIASGLRAAFRYAARDIAPAAVVFLKLEPHLVDVNAHPTKAEVRFKDPETIMAFIRDTSSSALSGSSPLAVAKLSNMAANMAIPLDPVAGDRKHLPLGRVLGVVQGMFAVAESDGGLVLVDLHAAHERLIYERLKTQARAQGVASRNIKPPVLVIIGMAGTAAIEARESDLACLGLIISVLDDETLSVSGIPDHIPDSETTRLVKDIAASLIEDPHADLLGTGLDTLCSLIACHAAFRGNDTIDTQHVDAMLREIEAGDNASSCMHGRPTSLLIPAQKLSELFGR
jgi:DNA mismatch repair protein MutL